MAEAAGVVSAKRSRDDSLMGAFGIPDTGNSKSAAYTGTAGEMTGLLAEKWYRFVATTDCFVHFHASEDATTSHMFVKAGVPEVFYMGELTRVSAIQSSSGGTLYATQLMTDDSGN